MVVNGMHDATLDVLAPMLQSLRQADEVIDEDIDMHNWP